MNRYTTLLLFLVLSFHITSQATAGETTPGAFDQSHALYANVVGEYVKDGTVDYSGLKSNPDKLKNYLKQTSTISKEEFETWSPNQQLAFLVNLYNAQTLNLIQESYPLKSIKDISKNERGAWEQPVVQLFGDNITLNALENEIIRKNYLEPRIHFALVCAAKGCPVLIDKPFLGPTLKNQLEAQTQAFLSDTRKNSIDIENKTLRLSPVFDWFAEDFVKESGSVIAFINPYFDGQAGPDFKIQYTSYDWSLNDRQ